MPRKRMRYDFWLEVQKPKQAELAREIDQLKNRRLFAPMVRDALRLFLSLSRGDMSVLLELFPDIRERLEVSPTKPTDDMLAIIEQHFEKLESKLIGDTPPRAQAARQPSPVKPPTGLDFEITRAKSNENTAFNLQISGVGIGSIGLHELSTECLQYGLERGKFSAKQAHQTREILQQRTSKTGGPKAMDVPQFAPPSFDDLALDF